jgi:hypothetical protein
MDGIMRAARFWKFGPFTVSVFSHYRKGFKPYPVTPLRCRVLQVRWGVRTWHLTLWREENFRR